MTANGQPSVSASGLGAIGRREWDAVVVGAGPAGALAAHELARRGSAVLLVDKAAFPRKKVCGGCLNSRALAALDQSGLADVPRRINGVPLGELRLRTRAHTARIGLPGSMAVARAEFDHALAGEAIRAGATFLPHTLARDIVRADEADNRVDEERGRAVGLERDGAQIVVTARVVIMADGLAGGFFNPGDETTKEDTAALVAENSRLGAGVITPAAPDYYQPGIIHMACGRTDYVGVARLADGRAIVAAALSPGWIHKARGLGLAVRLILHEAGMPEIPGLTDLPWQGTPPLTRRRRHVGARRLFMIGDTSGYVEPFTGEGMAWAMSAALGVAPLALRGIEHWDDSLATAWDDQFGRLVRRRQWICRAVAQLLRRPRACEAAVGLLGALPGLAGPFVRRLNR